MTNKERIKAKYFKTMFNLVCCNRFDGYVTYKKLLTYLHSVEFRYSIPKDKNRYEDGVNLRYRFALSKRDRSILEYLDGPCSVFEMMLSLAIRCEETIMDDPSYGDRTGQWFWGMVKSLGLFSMTDDHYDQKHVEETIERFLNREYEPNGVGGLFTIKDCEYDLREEEIWYQLCWYLDKFA